MSKILKEASIAIAKLRKKVRWILGKERFRGTGKGRGGYLG